MASELTKSKQIKHGTEFQASLKTIDSESDWKTKRPNIEREARSSLTGSVLQRSGNKPDGTPGHDRLRKIGHRRVDEAGQVTYKKKSTTELMSAVQLGIGQSITNLASRPKRDLLLQDFSIVETVSFPREGSNVTPAHSYSDFRFKTYAPVAFRYFRELFGIQPDDFLLSLSNYPLQELSNPGASGSIFYITDDDEFIIKTVQHKEADFLQKLLPGYYMNLNQNPRTLLPKFYGLFCYQCGGKNIRFVVMNNLLPSSIKMHEKYDLKGSTYKRKASRQERAKSSPTLKDLDFLALHPDGIMLEAETFAALVKTIDRDCRVLQSFEIMDYSLLMSVHNLDQAVRDRELKDLDGGDSPTGLSTCASVDTQGGTRVTRGRSIHQRLAQFSTTMEAIQAKSEPLEIDEEEIPPGGIPARNFRGERLLVYTGIIDILQSYRLAKKLEHAVKSFVHDGDTISVHRPGFYAQRFEHFFGNTVFKKIPSLDQPQVKGSHVRFKKLVQIVRVVAEQTMRHSPSHRKPVACLGKVSGSEDATKTSDSDTGIVRGRPDVLPRATPPLTSSMAEMNLAASESEVKTFALSVDLAPSDVTERSHLSSATNTAFSTPTHTSFTEGTPSYTASSPSCCSDMLASRALSSRVVATTTGESRPLSSSPSDGGGCDFLALDGAAGDSAALDNLSREVKAAMVDLANRISDETKESHPSES